MISSGTNQQIKDIIKLQKNARQRRKSHCFVAEGIKLVQEAGTYGKLQKIYVSQPYYQAEGPQIDTGFQGVPKEIVSESVFRQISETVTPQGILGLVSMPEYSQEEILQRENPLFLLLDDLRDPGNLGTILRTAEGAGVTAVFLNRESVDLFNPKAVRSTMGAIFRMPYLYVASLEELIREMRQRGIAVYGTWMEGSQVYDNVDYCHPCAIVIGNEANGISPGVMEQLTGRIRIPMEGKLESLNAAVAAAVVMYEGARQRRKYNYTKD